MMGLPGHGETIADRRPPYVDAYRVLLRREGCGTPRAASRATYRGLPAARGQ